MLSVQREPIHSAHEAQAAYNRLYQAPRTWLFRRYSVARRIINLLNPRPGGSLLDVACGDGALLATAREAGLDCYGVDISDQAVRLACSALGTGVAVTGDGESIPYPDDTFDYVTNIGSLEHYLDMERGAREMARVLKPGGLACILLPNAFGLTWSVWHAWRTGELADDGHQPLQRYGTRRAWHTLLTNNGLQIQRTVGHEQSWPRTADERRFYLARPREFLLLLLAPLIPLNLARCFVFLCTPQVGSLPVKCWWRDSATNCTNCHENGEKIGEN
jgi:SAM-dependent methyltransferase